MARRESFFAWPTQGLAAISESRNQPRRKTNLCETWGIGSSTEREGLSGMTSNRPPDVIASGAKRSRRTQPLDSAPRLLYEPHLN
jgi:hypothetical protein